MKVLAINGSPRKKWNTAMMLNKALEGAASKGAKTELIHLYDLTYTGCISCFECKKKGGKSYGRCAVKDDLKPVLDKVAESDAVIMGSPIYFGEVTGELRSFMERLMFQYLAYTNPPRTLFPKKINVGFIYTMNAPEAAMKEIGYDKYLGGNNERIMKMLLGSAETIYSTETLQFEDYSKVVFELFDPSIRIKRRREVFPEDLEKAFEMGARFAVNKI